MVGSKNSGAYSDITIEWPRPVDRTSTSKPNSCISAYAVDVFRARDNKKIQQVTTDKVSPAHDKASYTAKGLSAGDEYKFAVTALDNSGAKGAPGMPSASIKAAPQHATAVPV